MKLINVEDIIDNEDLDDEENDEEDPFEGLPEQEHDTDFDE